MSLLLIIKPPEGGYLKFNLSSYPGVNAWAREKRSHTEAWRSFLSVSQRVVQRLHRRYHPWFIGDGHGQNANTIVVRQRDRSRSRRQIDHIGKQIRVCVRFRRAVRRAAL